ncbi:DASH complex subunit, putative (Outer kinetochore protein, putative) [Candida maltosa Xu316]|uniref:DASH complex subunit DAD4 n=1 Tax=Candida maltosa (strain Xu316) TaxID=1245528 RepID=M3IP10_CANMX|nr:DASH complex subunit, putative (Outer kinetochore protein, putative) [Candida maltosa Xu316]
MENLNESVVGVNKLLEEINNNNRKTEVLASMWESYIRNSGYNLEVTGLKKEALFKSKE